MILIRKLIDINKIITWNKTKHLEVQKKLNSLITKDYNFFLGTIYCTSNDRFQNTFAYQWKRNVSELKEDKLPNMLLVGSEKGYLFLNF